MHKAGEQESQALRDRRDSEMWAGIFVLQVGAPLLIVVFLIAGSYLGLRSSGLRLAGSLSVWSIIFGQVMLAVFATSFGPWPMLQRLVVPPLVVAAELVFLTTFLGGSSEPILLGLLFGSVGIAAWAVALLPFGTTRKISRSQLVSGAGHELCGGGQFTIRELLILTLVSGLLLGLGRLVFEPTRVMRFYSLNTESILTFLLVVTAMSVSALLTMYFSLSPAFSAIDMVSGTIAVVFVAIACYLGLLVVGPRNMDGPFGKSIPALALVGQHFWIWLNLSQLRSNGWRLVRAD